MLSSVLNSDRAIEVNVEIMRAFVRLRQLFSTNKELVRKLAELERRVGTHDEQIQVAGGRRVTPNDRAEDRDIHGWGGPGAR